jgi:16S rRNA (cytosine967-C5)-methyltransferase
VSDDTGIAARRAALAALESVDERDAYSTIAVPRAVERLGSARDRAFASHLAYDTLRWQGTLDWALGQVVERGLGSVEAPLLRVLRLGALQILRTDVPSRAAVDTSATLAREAVPGGRAKGAAGFVNGVLRGLVRRRSALPWPDRGRDPVGHLVLATAHPRWIVEELRGRLPSDEVEALLDADNEPPGLTLRAIGDRGDLLAELAAEGHEPSAGAHGPAAVRLPGGADPRRIAAVRGGRAVVQDEASMIVVEAAEIQRGESILDACAGPGGKATYLSALAGPEGWVAAGDVHEHRARLVAAAAERVGVDLAVHVADATRPPFADGSFDVVLIDAPCTGLGTGRRRPEVRWRRTPEDIGSLAELQRSILAGVQRVLRPGGRLVYAACTWTERETTDVVARFLAAEGSDLTLICDRQLLPHRDDTDGMYVAVLQRGA